MIILAIKLVCEMELVEPSEYDRLMFVLVLCVLYDIDGCHVIVKGAYDMPYLRVSANREYFVFDFLLTLIHIPIGICFYFWMGARNISADP